MAHRKTDAAASPRRRGFLLTLGTGGAAAVAAALQPITNVTPETPPPSASAGDGYRETEHVRRYYRTTKI